MRYELAILITIKSIPRHAIRYADALSWYPLFVLLLRGSPFSTHTAVIFLLYATFQIGITRELVY